MHIKKENKINKNIIYSLVSTLFLFSFFFGIQNASAATTVNFIPESGTYALGDTIPVKVVINSDVSVNAVSIKVNYPTDILNLTSFSKTNSIISLWAQEPTFSNLNGTANIEGVILSGYTGKGGNVITLLFKSKKLGIANLKFDTASVFSNDGNGTDIATGKNTSSLTIIKKEITPTKPGAPAATVETPEIPDITLKTPILTYYLQETNPDEFTIIKGIADPLVDVEFTITNTITGGVEINHIETNSDGTFTFVPVNKLLLGTYSITARTNNGNGVTSAYMVPIEITVKQHFFIILIQKISNYITIITPLLAIIICLIFILLYGIHRTKKYKTELKNKLLETENTLEKDFKILEEDITKENLILEKMRENMPLEGSENTFLDKIKEDIETTSKEVDKDLKNLSK